MEDIIEFKKECCLCLKSFTEPRILPCLHTFCLKCLDKTGAMQKETQMPCPACGSEFTVPLDGLSGLPRNLLVEKVAYDAGDFLKLQEPEKSLCDVCTIFQGGEMASLLADKYCIICEEKMCPPCGDKHGKEKEHLVVALKTKGQTESREELEEPRCKTHFEALANLYCSYCKEVICTTCFEESHMSHNSFRVADAAAFISELAEKEHKDISGMKLEFHHSNEKLQREKMKFTETVKKMETEILKRCEEIKELVFKETKALLQELAVLRKERLEEIETEQRRMENQIFTLEKFKEYCAQIKDNAIPSYTCESESHLRSTAAELKAQQQSRIQSRILHLQVSFQKTDTDEFLIPLNNAVGKINVSCQYTTKPGLCPVDTSNKALYGMAHLQDKLYILSDSILVHRARKPFDRIGEIKTAEIKAPTDIVSCPKTSCLFKHDKDAACIWKVAVPENQVGCWLNKVNQPCAMTTSSIGDVIILKNNTGAEQSVTVEMYNQYGILTRQLHLPQTVRSLLRVYEAQAESYLGLGDAKVYKFRGDGSIIAEFDMSKHPECSSPARSLQLSPYGVFLSTWTPGYKANSKISRLGLDLEWGNVCVTGVCGENLCYLKETKQMAVREAQVVSIHDVLSL